MSTGTAGSRSPPACSRATGSSPIRRLISVPGAAFASSARPAPAKEATMAFIECRNLTREYRRGENVIRPLDGLDLDVEQGTFLALMGPSGSGKTTLLNLIAGIDRPTAGSLTIDGADLAQLSRSKLAAWRSQYVGYIFQLYNLVPVLTAYENVELPLLLHDLPAKQRHEKVAL